MKTLLRLQEIDMHILACKAREVEIPKQKNKFDVQKRRMHDELAEREQACKNIQIEIHSSEVDIGQIQAQINKYDQQLMSVKKNEEYQALLHEIDNLKKQCGLKEERLLALMMDQDEMKARLAEDQKRVKAELDTIDRECTIIDQELEEAVQVRRELESQREELVAQIDSKVLHRYERIRTRHKTSRVVVPLRGDSCSGCNVVMLPQVINEVLAGKDHACKQCGRLLYCKEHLEDNAESDAPEE